MSKNKVMIIAEAGINHNGSLETAFKMIDAAVKADADAVKFQTFNTSELVSANAPKAAYQKKHTGAEESQMDMLKKLELTEKDHIALIQYCRKKGIEFLSTPFDIPSVYLLHKLGLKTFKIPSGEITNLPYLRIINKLKKRVILSTGMSTLKEISAALRALKNCKVSLLHANTEYPTPIEHANVAAVKTLSEKFKLPSGYSDHTLGITSAVCAVALGAVIIEKHFTLDKNLPGPDQKVSLDTEELCAMVKAIREAELCLGNGYKKPSPSEIKNIAIARKSIAAKTDIKRGDIFTNRNLTAKRPAKGKSPMLWDKIIGTRAKKDYKEDDFI
ncbi:MAG: N-acetylneuraminate synthase [Endomicrobium sp.]|jgi:N,N'-diacetyllegionaminate synthase|nr:N-acetylneuraminate synthase [Endomicrobium sp.]